MEYFGDWQNINIFEQSAKWKIFTLKKGKKKKKSSKHICNAYDEVRMYNEKMLREITKTVDTGIKPQRLAASVEFKGVYWIG